MKDIGNVSAVWKGFTKEERRAICGKLRFCRVVINPHTHRAKIYWSYYYCNQWECEYCGLYKMKKEYRQMMITTGTWYYKAIIQNKYRSISDKCRKRNSQYYVYCGEKDYLFLATKQVESDMKMVKGGAVKLLISKYLKYPINKNQKRIRHSQSIQTLKTDLKLVYEAIFQNIQEHLLDNITFNCMEEAKQYIQEMRQQNASNIIWEKFAD